MANMNLEKEKNEFSQEFNEMLEEYFSESSYPITLKEKTKEMVNYIMPDHSYASLSFLVPKLAKIIKPDLSEEKIHMANTLGWIFQMYQACHVALDDFVDEGDQRYGKISWSKLQNHSKSIMVHDISIVRSLIYFILEKSFSESPSTYIQILHLFHQCDNKTSRALRLETHLLIENFRNGTTSLKSYNLETYELISSLKMGSTWFCLPMSLAMVTAGFQINENRDLYKNLEMVSGIFGILFQVLDDYFDSFGTTMGNDTKDIDIRRGQFSWCLITAKALCTNEDEVADLFNQYGIDNDESVNYIKSLYEKIDIPKLFKAYKLNACDNILELIDRKFGEVKEIQEMMKWFLNWGIKVYDE